MKEVIFGPPLLVGKMSEEKCEELKNVWKQRMEKGADGEIKIFNCPLDVRRATLWEEIKWWIRRRFAK